MSEERPQQIGKYEVIARLAVGGMAELFLAREQGLAGLERLVVLKKILPHLADEPSFVEMFLREARIAARLAHPNVVQIFDLGEEEGSFYITMEYIHGSTVRELQVLCDQSGDRIPLDVACAILLQSLRGLHAAHELADFDGRPLGLVHRDVSPHNLMCTTDGNVKLLDFGVAKATQDSLEATHSGNLKGKFAYMSPEQARRRELDRRSDVFGIGVVFWELLTGHRLFKRDSEIEMMEAVLAGNVEPPSSLDATIPRAIDDVVLRALRMERDDRWPTAEAMRQALNEQIAALGISASNDRVAAFVARVAGPHLDQRREILQQALERKSLTSLEKRDLIHVTGSESGASKDAEYNIAKSAQATRDAIRSGSSSRSRPEDDDPAGATGETVVSRHRMETQTDAASPPPDDASRRRTLFLGGAIFVALLAVAGYLALLLFQQSSEPTATEPVLLGEPLPFAFAPTVDPDLLREEVESLREYLQRETGRPVTMEVTSSYGESSEQLLDGRVSFAFLPPLMYVRTRAQNERVEPIAIKYFDGAKHSDGLLLVRGDSPFRSLADLSGRRFCFTDTNSTTGNFLPRAYIREQGFNLEEFIGEVRWSGEHLQALRDVIDGKCDAAAVYSGAFLSADRLDIPVSQLRTVAITGSIPQDAIVAGPEVSDGDKRAIREALLSFDPKAEIGQERLGETQRITGFHAVENSDYDYLRALVREFAAEP